MGYVVGGSERGGRCGEVGREGVVWGGEEEIEVKRRTQRTSMIVESK